MHSRAERQRIPGRTPEITGIFREKCPTVTSGQEQIDSLITHIRELARVQVKCGLQPARQRKWETSSEVIAGALHYSKALDCWLRLVVCVDCRVFHFQTSRVAFHVPDTCWINEKAQCSSPSPCKSTPAVCHQHPLCIASVVSGPIPEEKAPAMHRSTRTKERNISIQGFSQTHAGERLQWCRWRIYAFLGHYSK